MHHSLKVFIDFDGTITLTDSLEYILDKYAGSRWRSIEDQVTAQLLPERVALQREFDLVHTDLHTALKDLHHIAIDPYFPKFVEFCHHHRIELLILSGGFRCFIREILKHHHLDHLPFQANRLVVQNHKWKVIPINTPRLCETANHCKCYWLEESRKAGFIPVYIGDGNTDRCPAEHASIRFAKGNLKKYLEEKGLPFYFYQNFNDVLKIFEETILQEEF